MSNFCQTCGGLIVHPSAQMISTVRVCGCPYPQPQRQGVGGAMPGISESQIHERLQNIEETLEAVFDELQRLNDVLADRD